MLPQEVDLLAAASSKKPKKKLATRLYLCDDPAVVDVAPALDAGWESVTLGGRRLMTPQLLADALTTRSFTTGLAAGQIWCRQFISHPLEAGIVFVNASSTFTCQVQGNESAANDNIIQRVRKVFVVSRDGNTVQATLIAFGNHSIVTEWSTSLRNLTFLNATAVGAGYTTVVGDRLVLEMGYGLTSGTSVTGSLRFGADAAGTGDLAVNETDTTNTLRPWLESSVNLTFETLPPPPNIGNWAVGRSRTW